MSIDAIGAEILGGGQESTPPPWYTSLKHPMALGVERKTDPKHCSVTVVCTIKSSSYKVTVESLLWKKLVEMCTTKLSL